MKPGMHEQFKRLINHFQPNPVPAKQFYSDWAEKMKDFEPEIIEQAVRNYIETVQPNPYRFPTIMDFWIVADSLQYNQHKQKEKKQDGQAYENIYGGAEKTPVGIEFARLIQKIVKKQITRVDATEETRRLGKKYDINSANKEADKMMLHSTW